METITRWIVRPWFYKLAVKVVYVYISLVYGLRAEDTDNVPDESSGGMVFASNHISTFDPMLVGVTIPRTINFMAKKELFENRYLRPIVLGLQTFPVDRSRNDLGAIKEALRRIKQGLAVGIFAQGTRNKGDAEALNGAAYLTQRAGVPLVPAAIWREGRRFCIRYGEPIVPEGRSREEMHAITQELMRRINAMLPDQAGDRARFAKQEVKEDVKQEADRVEEVEAGLEPRS